MAEALFDRRDKPEADGFVEQFLVGLTTDEKRELLAFMQGFKLAKGLEQGKTAESANGIILQTAAM